MVIDSKLRRLKPDRLRDGGGKSVSPLVTLITAIIFITASTSSATATDSHRRLGFSRMTLTPETPEPLRRTSMPICHEHNLARPVPKQCPYGLRVKLRSTDPFKNLVGSEWNKEHWFATREERDRALKEMSGRYLYFRPGDQPSLEFEKIDR